MFGNHKDSKKIPQGIAFDKIILRLPFQPTNDNKCRF